MNKATTKKRATPSKSPAQPALNQSMSPRIAAAVLELDELLKGTSKIAKDLDNDRAEFERFYQRWYSKALRTVKLLIPERAEEFEDMYKPAKRRTIDVSTYGIQDFLLGISVKRGLSDVFDPRSVAISRLNIQLTILASVFGVVNSRIANLRSIIQADLFDSELAAARELLKHGHIRPAGVLAGVTLEAHLAKVVESHKVKMVKRNPTLADYNNALRDADVYDLAQWRSVQWMSDLRNLALHKRDLEPTPVEMQDLIAAVDKAVKTLS